MKNSILIILLVGILITQGIIAFCLWENRGIGRYQMSGDTVMIDTKFGWMKFFDMGEVINFDFHENAIWTEKPKIVRP